LSFHCSDSHGWTRPPSGAIALVFMARRILRRFCTRNNYSSTFESSPKNQRTGYALVTHVQKITRPNVGTAWAWQRHAGGSDTETHHDAKPEKDAVYDAQSLLPNHTLYFIIHQVRM
jgi:hypothetical protein